MTTPNETDRGPLWLAIEERLQQFGSTGFSGSGMEEAVQKLAGELDQSGYQVSGNAGYMMELRRAVAATAAVGRPMMNDLNDAFGALTLDDLASPYGAAVKLIEGVGESWPLLKDSEKRSHILRIVEKTRLDLLVAKAKELAGEGGIRLLIAEAVAPETIMDRLDITQEEFDRVMALVEAERAERDRVAGLLEGVEGKPESDRIRHLITSDVAEDLIVEMAGVDQTAIDAVNKAMEEEIREKQRLAEEAAAKKAAAAAGPALDDIPADEMLDHIEALREILEFSDVEDEIRVMCEQSSVPRDLVEIAISDPDKLDDLEALAGG